MDNYCKQTIELYQDFISFLEISEKYLKRPPFKYIFQLFLSLNNKTGFAEGLLRGEEASAEYYSTPERKVGFVKKVSALVSKLSGKPCALKAKSVIKGEECDKTNEFLCEMFHAATAQGSAPPPTAQSPEPPKAPAEREPKPPAPRSPPAEARREAPKEPVPPPAPRAREESSKAPERKPAPPAAPKEAEAPKPPGPAEGGKAPAAHKSITMGTIADAGNYWSESAAAELSIEEMRSLVQKVTQNTNPLGKLIDYAEDDLEHMGKEYKNWVFVYHEASMKLEKLEGEQDNELESFNNKIQQLDEQMLEFEEKIAGLRGKIHRTDVKIASALQKFFA